MIEIRTSLPLPSIYEIIAQLSVYFIVEDYTNYWIHRFLHTEWGLYEKVHKIHHEYTAPISYVAPYAHWAEVLIWGIPSFLGPALAPGHMITFWLWIALRQVEAIETHSGCLECWIGLAGAFGMLSTILYGEESTFMLVFHPFTRVRSESCSGSSSKACKEKMRRDKLNDKFMELGAILDPGRPPKTDKATILIDVARMVLSYVLKSGSFND